MGQPPATTDAGGKHVWKFFRAGGFDQVKLESGADLTSLDQLDQKLWVALSCPTRGLEFDSKTLDLIDTDHDGHIRVPEIIAAAKWAGANLKNSTDLVRGADALPLDAINDTAPEGKQLLASAKQILINLGKANAAAITTEDAADTARIFAQTKFNGDGVVPADSADDDATRAAIADIIACLGADTDRSTKPGVNQARVDQFFADLQAYSDWQKKAEDTPAAILPLGEGTAAAFDAVKAVRAKVDDYFTRCRLAAFDARALAALNRSEADFLALAMKDLSASGAEVASFPLARVEAGKPLPLVEGVNPAWAGAMSTLQGTVAAPILGAAKTALTAEEWSLLTTRLAPYEAWVGGKAGASVEKLGLKRVRDLLASKAKDAVTALIAQDKALEPEMNAIVAVERLVLYYRDLYQLLNNFVAFADFYSRKRKAVFQAGTLYLDGRSCDLCVRVDDAGRHAALAVLSKAYLAYCDCTRKGSPEKLAIAAAFTGGDSDNLMVGRNGVFYDRKGQDWDATITKITEQPISIRQAVFAPYKRIGRMIGDQIEKMASARDKAITDKAAGGVEAAAQKVDAPKPAAPPPAFDIAKFAGIFAAIGLAIGAIGAVLAAVASGFLNLTWWQMPLAILGIFILISCPSVIIAWLKLRKRNLGPILDANGWAVNARVKINIPFGRALTGTPKLPPNAIRTLKDPYAQKKSPVFWLVLILIVAAIVGGLGYWFLIRKGDQGGKIEAPKEAGATAAAKADAAKEATPQAPAPAK